MNEKNNKATGTSWGDIRNELLTPDERAEVDLRVQLVRNKLESETIQAKAQGATGTSWAAIRNEILTPEERALVDIQVQIAGAVIEARQEKQLTQKELGENIGIKQPAVARIEKGKMNPSLETIIKVLAPLGKTLYVGDLEIEGKTG